MNISQLAQNRYTTKVFDPQRTVPAEEIVELETVLRCLPSSVNSQPWHFVVVGSPEGKNKVIQGMPGPSYAYNAIKVRDASHSIVLCARNTLDENHLQQIIGCEQADGRFATMEARDNQDKIRRHYVNLHQEQLHDASLWIEKQLYIGLGGLLFAAAAKGIDTCAMEGFDRAALDQALDLPAKGLHSVLVVALGYRSPDDFNARLPKSRLPAERVISHL